MYDANCCGAKWPFPPHFFIGVLSKVLEGHKQQIYGKVMLGFSGSAWFLF